jgi:hypothetical protein
MTEENEDTDYSWWDEAKLNFWDLMQAESDEQYDETVGESMDKAQSVDYKTGLIVNVATIAVGYGLYEFIGGIIGIVGIILAILSGLSILKWVIQV